MAEVGIRQTWACRWLPALAEDPDLAVYFTILTLNPLHLKWKQWIHTRMLVSALHGAWHLVSPGRMTCIITLALPFPIIF